MECKEYITKQLQNFENFEHTSVGSQLQFQKSVNDNLQTLTHISEVSDHYSIMALSFNLKF